MTITSRRFSYYGRIGHLPRHAGEMHDLIDAHVTRARKLRNVPDWHTTLVEELGELLLARIIAHGCKLPHDEILDLLSLDVGLNVQGLKHWLDHTRTIDQSKI